MFRDELSSMPELEGLIGFHEIESTLHKRRRLNQPRNPRTPAEAMAMLQAPNKFSHIYRGSVENGGGVAVVFGSQSHLNTILENIALDPTICTTIFVDATFGIVPKMKEQKFYELLFVQVQYRNIAVPLFGALMTGKTEELYTEVLKFIAAQWPEFQPAEIMVDFEKALHNATKAAWPLAGVHGCRFHFAQACLKYIQTKQLAKEYISNPQVKKWLKSTMGLCLLPADAIVPVWMDHCQKLSQFHGSAALTQKLNGFKNYMNNFWIRRVTPKVFSVFGLNHKTNNYAESLHARLNRDFKSKHPGFWRFMELYEQLVINEVTADLAVIHQGRLPRRIRPADLQKVSIRKYEEQLVNGILSPLQYFEKTNRFFKGLKAKKVLIKNGNAPVSAGEEGNDSSEESAYDETWQLEAVFEPDQPEGAQGMIQAAVSQTHNNDELICVICMERYRDCFLWPCRHWKGLCIFLIVNKRDESCFDLLSMLISNPGDDMDDDDHDDVEDVLRQDAIEKNKELGEMMQGAFDHLSEDSYQDSENDGASESEDEVHLQRIPNRLVSEGAPRNDRLRIATYKHNENLENVQPTLRKPDPIVRTKPLQQSDFGAQNRVPELQILLDAKVRELERLQQNFQNQAQSHSLEIRSVRQQLEFLKTEKANLDAIIEGNQAIFQEKTKENTNLRSLLESVKAEKDRVENLNRELTLELTTHKARVETLEEEISELKRCDTAKRLIQNAERKLETLQEVHRRELSECNDKLLAERQKTTKLTQELERSKRTLNQQEREWESQLADKTATVNRLTRLIKDAQNQCAEMVLESPRNAVENSDVSILRCQALETDVKRLQQRNRSLKHDLDVARRQLENKRYQADATYRGLLEKDAWEDEKIHLEDQIQNMRNEMDIERERSSREKRNMLMKHKFQMSTLNRKLKAIVERVRRMCASKNALDCAVIELKVAFARTHSSKAIDEVVKEVEMEWKTKWETAQKERDVIWIGKLKDAVDSVKTRRESEIMKLQDELKNRTAEILKLRKELQDRDSKAKKTSEELAKLQAELEARKGEVAKASEEFQKLEKEFLASCQRPLSPVPNHTMVSSMPSNDVEQDLHEMLIAKDDELTTVTRKLQGAEALFRDTIHKWLTEIEILKTIKQREAELNVARVNRYKSANKALKEKLKTYKNLLRERQLIDQKKKEVDGLAAACKFTMVFESVVTDLLNRFLGAYVENLDRSQLKLGIWGGDVVLRNLRLKKNALDSMDLPVRVSHGFLEKMELKIPWTNLYKAPVIAVIDGVFLIAVPKSTVEYDAAKEEKMAWEVKQNRIQRGEEIHELKSLAAGEGADEKDATFVEKLSFQIIKNIQIRVGSVHIRYEDTVSNPSRPFNLGVTMSSLVLESTDDSWKPGTIPKEDAKLVYKLATLNSFNVYWTHEHMDLSAMSPNDAMLIDFLNHWSLFVHVMGPITSEAKLRLNPKPEQVDNYALPKIFLDLVISSLDIVFLRRQYQDFMFLSENIGRMRRAEPYRKYRPNVKTYRGHYKKWWHFAYTCILETEVRRRRNNFSWARIQKHGEWCRQYQKLYEGRIKDLALKREPGAKMKADLEALEKKLDVFNILRLRRQAELNVKKDAETRPKRTGWLGGWFGSGNQEVEGDFAKKLQQEMSPAEKAKLYEAIGYGEDEVILPSAYPSDYVAHLFKFSLTNLGVYVRRRVRSHGDSSADQFENVLHGALQEVELLFKQIPAVQLSSVESLIGGMSLTGVPEKIGSSEGVNLLRSMHPRKNLSDAMKHLDEGKDARELIDGDDEKGVLMWCTAEVNPREGVDYGFYLGSRPIEIYYDGPTAAAVMDVFKMPEESVLTQLELTAYEKMEDIRTMSALGLQYAMETSKIVDFDVKFRGPFLIVPDGGRFTTNAKLLVVGLGDLIMKSQTDVNRKRKNTLEKVIRRSTTKGSISEDILSEMRSQSYHQYQLELKHMQVLVVDPSVDWRQEIRQKETPFHVMAPMSFSVNVGHCVLDNDPALPKLAVVGGITEIKIDLEETQFYDLLNISYSAGASYPAPERDEELRAQKKLMLTQYAKNRKRDELSELSSIPEGREVSIDEERKKLAGAQLEKKAARTQLTQLDLKFEIKETKLMIRAKVPLTEKLYGIPLLHFGIVSLQADLLLKTKDIEAGLSVGGVEVNTIAEQKYQFEESEKTGRTKAEAILPLIRTAMIAGDAEYLVNVRYSQVDRSSPKFLTPERGGVLQRIDAQFADFDISLEETAVRELMEFVKHVQIEIDAIGARFAPPPEKRERRRRSSSSAVAQNQAASKKFTSENIHNMFGETAAAVGVKQSAIFPDGITFFLAELRWRSLGLKLTWGSRGNAYQMRTVGLYSAISMRKDQMDLAAKIEDIHLCESDPIGPYATLVKSASTDAMKLKVNLYKLKTDHEKYVDVDKNDISVEATFGRLDVIYVQRSFLEMLEVYNDVMAVVASPENPPEKVEQEDKKDEDLTQAVTDALVEIGERPQRIKLNVSIKAPVVHVPRNINSLEAFVADFGEIKIINEFRLGETCNEAGHPSMYSDFLIRLTNLNMSRCLLAMSKGSEEILDVLQIVSKVMIFEPITVTVGCQQNLSAEWLKKAPVMEFYGHFEDIKGNLSDEDYDVLMLTLSENLSDNPSKRGSTLPRKRVDNGLQKSGEIQVAEDALAIESVPDTQTKRLPPESERVTLACLLRLETISLELFNGSSELNRADDAPVLIKRNPKRSLSIVKLTGICLGARMKSDSTLQSHVRLEDCVVHDSRYRRRKSTSGIVDLFHRKHKRQVDGLSEKGTDAERQKAGQDKSTDSPNIYEEVSVDDTYMAGVDLEYEDDLLLQLQKRCDDPIDAMMRIFRRYDAGLYELEESCELTRPADTDENDEFYDAPSEEEDFADAEEASTLPMSKRSVGGADSAVSGAKSDQKVDMERACSFAKKMSETGKQTAKLFKEFSDKIRSCAGSKDNMLDIVFKINEIQETHVKIRTAHSVVVADIEYLMALSEFFLISEETRQSTRNVVVRKRPSNTASASPEVKPGLMVVRLLVNEPDIALVEDLNDINSNAIIVNTRLNFIASFDGPVTKFQGSFSKLRMYSGVYNPKRRQETTNMILKPTGFSVVMKTVVNEEQKIDLNVGPLIFRIDPSTIALMSSLSAKAAQCTKTDADLDESAEVTLKSRPTLSIWEFADLEPNDFKFAEEDPEEVPPLVAELGFGTDVLSIGGSSTGSSIIPNMTQLLVLEAKKVLVTLEFGSPTKPIPIVMLDASFVGDASNWTYALDASFTASCQVAAYNPEKGVWEPLLEPVETLNEALVVRRAFELDFLVIGRYDGHSSAGSMEDVDLHSEVADVVDSGYSSLRLPSPKLTISCVSKDTLNLTVSKTSLEVMTELSASFADAMTIEMQKKPAQTAPYILQNDLGVDVVLELEKSNFKVLQNAMLSVDEQWVLGAGDNVGLDWFDLSSDDGVAEKRFVRQYKGVDEILKEQSTPEQRFLYLNVHNFFQFPIQVFYLGKKDNKESKILCATADPGKTANLPLHAVFNATAELYFGAEGVEPSVLRMHTSLELQQPFSLLPVLLGNTTVKGWGHSAKFVLQLYPTASVRNLLPIPIEVRATRESEPGTTSPTAIPAIVNAGETVNLPVWIAGVSWLSVALPEYQKGRWECRVKLDAHPKKITTITLSATAQDSKKAGVSLGVLTKQEIRGSKFFQIFSPFWMVNETGKMLTYKYDEGICSPFGKWTLCPEFCSSESACKCLPETESDSEGGDDQFNTFYHPGDTRSPVLFAPSKHVEMTKKQGFKLRVSGSEFSDRVPLDNVGDVGLVSCTSKDQIFQIGVSSVVSSFTLTRFVILRPYFTFTNSSLDLPLFVRGGGRYSDTNWTELPPGTTIPWWPIKQDENKIVLKAGEYAEVSDAFDIVDAANELLLRLRNPIGGVFVECTTTDSARSVSFSRYQPGMAPVVLLNHTTNMKIRFWQKNADKSHFLLPGKKIIFAWQPGEEGNRTFVWECGKSKINDKLLQDRCGQVEGQGVYWVSFVHGSQRVLLFTRNVELASAAQMSFDLEAQDVAVNLTLTDVGLSLVDDKARKEVMYLSVSSSGITWDLQHGPGKPYKSMAANDTLALERAYGEFIMQQAQVQMDGPRLPTKISISRNMTVDFKRMMLWTPSSGRLRRTFHTGVWIHYASSPHQMSVHVKLHNVQVDCQLHDCTYPVVFAPVQPAKTVAQLGEGSTRPFVEVSLRTRKTESTTVAYHCRYLKVLVQEFFVKIDNVFVNGLLHFFGTSEKVAVDFDKDMNLIANVGLSSDALVGVGEDPMRIYFELLHFSPIKMHLSYSLAGFGAGGATGIRSEIVDLFLQSIGVTLTDVDDVVFR
ncbi:unnamed protein product [Notodromas monacha]|uniref:Uncharacterized protein n=1 Tax=Notodromas monacha TaxID=399045 RepID=A0A7R9BQH1_9CRUS|nr:unnamed protein product [Notodromas monacha]CAG0918881.1 unnamed protein product [Notodromas monacha]